MAEIRIPDLGDFDEVEVVEIHVAQGDSIQEGDPVLTLETEKAAMDVPSTVSGVVENVVVKIIQFLQCVFDLFFLLFGAARTSKMQQKHRWVVQKHDVQKIKENQPKIRFQLDFEIMIDNFVE